MQDTVNQLSRTLALANRFIMQQLANRGLCDIAPSHGDIFMQLFTHGDMPMGELAERIDRDPSTATALVKKLARAGYVATAKSKMDKRVTVVSLTEKGAALRPVFAEVSDELYAVQARNLTQADFDTLNATLHTVQENFKTELEGTVK